MQMHDARLKRAPPSQSRAITVADFHHNRGLAALEEDGSSDDMKVAASATTTLSSAIQIAHAPPPDEFAGMDENAHARSAAVCDSLSARRAAAVAIAQKKQDETFVDPELERILGAVLDRCYLLCHDREWKAWQAVGAVGGRGSYVYSRCQPRGLWPRPLLACVSQPLRCPGALCTWFAPRRRHQSTCRSAMGFT